MVQHKKTPWIHLVDIDFNFGVFFTVNLSESMYLIFIYSFSFPDNFFFDNNHVLSPIIRNYIYKRSSNTVL